MPSKTIASSCFTIALCKEISPKRNPRLFEYQCQKTNFVHKTGFPSPQKAVVFTSFWFTHILLRDLFCRTENTLNDETEAETNTKQERTVKCHPYLWLAPHLPLVPCLNPQSACYIYIVMRASLLTKHFLFDCTNTHTISHKHKYKHRELCKEFVGGKFFRTIFLLVSWWCRLCYLTLNLEIFFLFSFSLMFIRLFFCVFIFLKILSIL